MIRRASRAPVRQSLGPFRPIPSHQSLRLAVADVQQHRRRFHTQRARLHPRQYLDPCQFPRTHRGPSQSVTSSEATSLGGHFYFVLKQPDKQGPIWPGPERFPG
jgi:hypothetical protein